MARDLIHRTEIPLLRMNNYYFLSPNMSASINLVNDDITTNIKLAIYLLTRYDLSWRKKGKRGEDVGR